MPAAGAIIGAVGSIAGGSMQARGASDAADAQTQANREAMQMQLQMFNTMRGDMQPAIQAGNVARQQLMAMLGLPTQGLSPAGQDSGLQMSIEGASRNPRNWSTHFEDQLGIPGVGDIDSPLDTLETPFRNFGDWDGSRMRDDMGEVVFSAPNQRVQQGDTVQGEQPQDPNLGLQQYLDSTGYQFELGEGQQAIDRSAAARGGALSGRAIRESQRYGQGLASTRVGDYLNRLASLAGVGQTATAQAAQMGQNTGVNVGNLMSQSGAARASGYAGQANAWGNTLGNLGQLYGYYANQQQQQTGGGQGANPGGGQWGGAYAFSDGRLKSNVKNVCRIGPLGLKKWSWNNLYRELTGVEGLGIGFMAEEVQEVYPDCVSIHDSGYKIVDMAKLLNKSEIKKCLK